MTVTVKTKSGAIMDYVFDSIIAIDGVPYVSPQGDLAERVAQLEGRVGTIESVFMKLEDEAAIAADSHCSITEEIAA